MTDPIGPQRMQAITDTVVIQEDPKSGAAVMVQVPAKMVIKRWAAVVGMENAAWECMVDYAKRAVEFNGVDWDTDDPDLVYPMGGDFATKYLDPVGYGEKTSEEASAELMEKLMRRFNKQ